MSVMDARWQRVNELFHAALLRTPADRHAFLAMECGADSQLRLEVQSLLAAHDVGGSATFASVPTPVEGPNAGGITRWGHFEVARKIGEGSFGEVYEARDTWLERSVALKLVRHERVDRSRFLHEARTLARVRHPNVVEILSAEDHDGRLGFSMELVEGDTLADVVAHEGVFSAADAAVLGHDVCGALAAVHAMGIVHRDIKAQNVMRESENGRIVLMDFGAGEAMKLSLGHGCNR